MGLTKEEKENLKEKIPRDVNGILENYELPYRMDGIVIMNTAEKISFIGNVRIHDPSKVNMVKMEIESYLEKYGKVVINLRDVVPCCEAPYTYINFHIDYKVNEE